MKFSVTKTDFLAGLQQVQNIVSSRTTLPILANVLIETTDGGLQLTTTDLEMGVQCRVRAIAEKTGAVTLPAKRLLNIVRELPAEEIQIEVDERSCAAISCGGSFFRVMGLPEKDFPPLPAIADTETLRLEQLRLRDMLKRTSYAMSSDETRYVLNGVLLHLHGEKLTIAATDGRRLALVEEDASWGDKDLLEVILPAKAVHELERLLRDSGSVEVHLMPNQIAFDLGDLLLVSKLIEGQFPNFQQVIPSESLVHVQVSREALLQALHRVSILLTDRTNSVRITFRADAIVIDANAPEVGEAHEELPAQSDGGELTIAFNPAYMMDPLRQLEIDTLNIDLSDTTSPGVIRTQAYSFLYVIMPMRVKA